MYLHFIINIQTILCYDSNDKNGKIFFKYNIIDKFIAFNYFYHYFQSDNYEIIKVQYIIFCLDVFFRYYNLEKYNLLSTIKEKFYLCSRFLFQDFNEKKKYLNDLKSYIINDIDINNINEDYFKDHLLKIKYGENTYEINPLECFFVGSEDTHLLDIIYKKNYSFDYLKQKNFPLFINDDNLNNNKNILQSNIINEYIDIIKNIPSKKLNIFYSEKIINEINKNSIWVIFPLDKIHGITERETFTIFLNSYFKENDEEKLIIETSSKVATVANEDCNHALRLILVINDIDIKKSTPNDGKIFKKISYNKITKCYRDQGDKFEVIIFGDKISKIFIGGSIMILNIDNYNLSIEEFRKKFKRKNKINSVQFIKKELKDSINNENNKLLQHFTGIKFEECKDKNWIKYEQNLPARQELDNNNNNSQYILFGNCGTVHDDD